MLGYQRHSVVDYLQGEAHPLGQRKLDNVGHAAVGADTIDGSIGSETFQRKESTPPTEQLLQTVRNPHAVTVGPAG